MKWRRLLFFVILLLGILGSCYLIFRRLAVPDIGFKAAGLSDIWRGEGYEPVNPDSKISGMIRRAKLDHFISPISGLHGGIVFDKARTKGDEVYLIFRAANVSGTIVVYCGNSHTHNLLWKMVLVLDA